MALELIEKKSHSKLTKFKTLFGTIYVPQIQIRVKLKNNKEYQLSITRTLLGISPRFQIPDFMKEFLGWIGAVTTYRVCSSSDRRSSDKF